MAKPMKGVKEDRVGEVVQVCITDDGATKVVAKREPLKKNGKWVWTVEAD